MNLENILTELKIKPINKNTRFYTIKKGATKDFIFYNAFIYDKYDDICENIGILYALNEADLKRDLLNIYGIVHIYERNYENFLNWHHKNIGYLSKEKTYELREKFTN